MYPKLFELGPLPIHTYGLLLAAALLLSITVASRLAESDGVSRKLAWDLGFVIVLSAIIGAKLLLILTNFGYYWRDPAQLFSLEFLRAGGVYYGGLLGAIAGAAYFTRRHSPVSFWRLADIAAPAIPLGQAIGRLGCFSAGCDYGKPTDVPWAVTFTSEYSHQMVGTPLNVALHPYQLYESGATLILFLLLLYLFTRRAFVGQVFSAYLMSYSTVRFLLEFYRGDLDRGFVLGGLLSTSQFISLLLFPAGLLLYFWLRRRSS